MHGINQGPSQTGSETEPSNKAPGSALVIHAILLFLTFITTCVAGALYVHPDSALPIRDGLPFAGPLMAILLTHEMGRFGAARRHNIPCSLPYFLPLPSLFVTGTMGSVVRLGACSLSRRKLLDLGASGPLAALAASLAVLIIGVQGSVVATVPAVGLLEGNSLVYAAVKLWLKGQWLPLGGVDIQLNPTAFAGWVGLLLTGLRLLPLPHLDGGYMALAFLGDRWYRLVPRLQIALFGFALVAAGLAGVRNLGLLSDPEHPFFNIRWQLAGITAAWAAVPWLVVHFFSKLMRVMFRKFELPLVEAESLPRSRKVLLGVMMAVFVAIFPPVIFQRGFAPADVTREQLSDDVSDVSEMPGAQE